MPRNNDDYEGRPRKNYDDLGYYQKYLTAKYLEKMRSKLESESESNSKYDRMSDSNEESHSTDSK